MFKDRKWRSQQLHAAHAVLILALQTGFARRAQHEEHHGIVRLPRKLVLADAHRKIQRCKRMVTPRGNNLANTQLLEWQPVAKSYVRIDEWLLHSIMQRFFLFLRH